MCVDLAFAFDMLATMRTGFFDHNNVLQMSSRKIIVHYVKGWFTVDLLSTIPFDRFVEASGKSG